MSEHIGVRICFLFFQNLNITSSIKATTKAFFPKNNREALFPSFSRQITHKAVLSPLRNEHNKYFYPPFTPCLFSLTDLLHLHVHVKKNHTHNKEVSGKFIKDKLGCKEQKRKRRQKKLVI